MEPTQRKLPLGKRRLRGERPPAEVQARLARMRQSRETRVIAAQEKETHSLMSLYTKNFLGRPKKEQKLSFPAFLTREAETLIQNAEHQKRFGDSEDAESKVALAAKLKDIARKLKV